MATFRIQREPEKPQRRAAVIALNDIFHRFSCNLDSVESEYLKRYEEAKALNKSSGFSWAYPEGDDLLFDHEHTTYLVPQNLYDSRGYFRIYVNNGYLRITLEESDNSYLPKKLRWERDHAKYTEWYDRNKDQIQAELERREQEKARKQSAAVKAKRQKLLRQIKAAERQLEAL